MIATRTSRICNLKNGFTCLNGTAEHDPCWLWCSDLAVQLIEVRMTKLWVVNLWSPSSTIWWIKMIVLAGKSIVSLSLVLGHAYEISAGNRLWQSEITSEAVQLEINVFYCCPVSMWSLSQIGSIWMARTLMQLSSLCFAKVTDAWWWLDLDDSGMSNWKCANLQIPAKRLNAIKCVYIYILVHIIYSMCMYIYIYI